MQIQRIDPSVIKRVAQNIPRAGLGGLNLSPQTLQGLLGKGLLAPGDRPNRPPPAGGAAAVVAAPGVKGGDLATDPSLYYDIERSLNLTPWTVLPQHFKVYPLAGTVAGGVLAFTPQRDVIPFALSLREAEAGGTLQGMLVGIQPLFASGGAIPASMFGPMSPDTRWLPPTLCQVGQSVTANVTGITRGCLWCADVDEDSPMAEPLRSRLMPFGFNSGAIANAATANIVVPPSIDIRLRRLALTNPAGDFAAAPDVVVTSILVGNQPQTEGAGNIPIDAFLDTFIAGYMDGDTCRVGMSITIGVLNNSGGAVTLTGSILGDSAK